VAFSYFLTGPKRFPETNPNMPSTRQCKKGEKDKKERKKKNNPHTFRIHIKLLLL
jgi:hypothetical protein